MKVGFDFDSTLATRRIQKVAKKFIADGHEVWVVTTRQANPSVTLSWNNKLLFKIVDELNIPRNNVIFTEGSDKHSFLKGFDLFFDDDEIEIELIGEYLPECGAIHITSKNFK
jgi:hypothetical protein